MFSRIAFLLSVKNLLRTPSFLPPIAFFKSMSICLPNVNLSSFTKGVIVVFLDTGASIRLLSVPTILGILVKIPSISSGLAIRLFKRGLYSGFSSSTRSSICSVVVTSDAAPLRSSTSLWLKSSTISFLPSQMP